MLQMCVFIVDMWLLIVKYVGVLQIVVDAWMDSIEMHPLNAQSVRQAAVFAAELMDRYVKAVFPDIGYLETTASLELQW